MLIMKKSLLVLLAMLTTSTLLPSSQTKENESSIFTHMGYLLNRKKDQAEIYRLADLFEIAAYPQQRHLTGNIAVSYNYSRNAELKGEALRHLYEMEKKGEILLGDWKKVSQAINEIYQYERVMNPMSLLNPAKSLANFDSKCTRADFNTIITTLFTKIRDAPDTKSKTEVKYSVLSAKL
jgi:hypothetical protein